MDQSAVVEKMYAQGQNCPYCNRTPRLVDSIEIYRNKSFGYVWYCSYCNAFSPSSPDKSHAVGPLADPFLRKLQMQVNEKYHSVSKSRNHKSNQSAAERKKLWVSILEQAKIPSSYTVYQMRPSHCKDFIRVCENMLAHR